MVIREDFNMLIFAMHIYSPNVVRPSKRLLNTNGFITTGQDYTLLKAWQCRTIPLVVVMVGFATTVNKSNTIVKIVPPVIPCIGFTLICG